MPLKTKDFNPSEYPYPECREQHVWKPFDGTIDPKEKIAYRVQVCANCPTKRHQSLSMKLQDYGQIVRSSYTYPTDYQVKGGMGKMEKGMIRMQNFMDSIE